MSDAKMTGIKGFLVDFPTANGRIVSTILLIWFTGIIVASAITGIITTVATLLIGKPTP